MGFSKPPVTQSNLNIFQQGMRLAGGGIHFTTTNPGSLVVTNLSAIVSTIVVHGDLSATGTIFGAVNVPSSTALTTLSADWESTYTTVWTNSAAWATNTIFLSGIDNDGAIIIPRVADNFGIGLATLGAATQKLTVGGNVSARNVIYASGGNSDSDGYYRFNPTEVMEWMRVGRRT